MTFRTRPASAARVYRHGGARAVLALDGCEFDVSSPVITRRVKSSLLFHRYERGERQALRRHLDPAKPVVELGGGIGVVACVINRRLSNPHRHVVVEANARLIEIIRANAALVAHELDTIVRHVSTLIVEIHDDGACGPAPTRVVGALSDAGYRVSSSHPRHYVFIRDRAPIPIVVPDPPGLVEPPEAA